MPHALVIDDNSPNAEVLETLLHSQGMTVSVAYPLSKLSHAIESSEQIDVVFLDLEFPNADGFELFHKLRAHDRLANVPIIAYSVHISEVNRARVMGFQGFLGKPIRANEFPVHLRKILNGVPVWEY